MITITHNRARLTVHPEHAEPTRELLALIDKSKGRKGRKFSKYQIDDDGKRRIVGPSSMGRNYPAFEPGMSTSDYVARYAALNGHLSLAKVGYTHADRPAPMLDPAQPEVEELPCEQ
jgi:hypothetical protein